MQLPRRRGRALPAQQIHDYPQHLRAWVDVVPAAAGVYLFHQREGEVPLYIGKSVNLRARLLSHLRNADEARMLQQTQRISYQRTAGELGALLLEAQLIKQLRPLYNQKLRDKRELCSLRVAGVQPQVVYSNDVDFSRQTDLYGLFGSRRAALDVLRNIADQKMLCYGVLGLEKLAPGRGCFRAAIRQCAGACRGDESIAAHQQRLLSGLLEWQVQPWPFDGPVALSEEDEELSQFHVINNWQYLGSAGSRVEARALAKAPAQFDADTYLILVRPVMSQCLPVVPL